MNQQPLVVTARSPRRRRADDTTLRVFPGASSSVVGISNQPQQFYSNTSHLHHNNNNHHHNQRFPLQAHFRQSPHLQGFANSPTQFTNTTANDDAMDVQLGQLPIV
jgi:hypothetical protein